MKNRIGVIDIGMGNVKSVSNMVAHGGCIPVSITSASDMSCCSKFILPGVGSFDRGMKLLNESGIIDPLSEAKENGARIMGICLGMQLLANASGEGESKGLGWIDAEVIQFDETEVVVPHMGWSSVEFSASHSCRKQFSSLQSDPRFYFVHSYYMECNDIKDVLMTCRYGKNQFACGVGRENVFGFQFHPEKSHSYGISLMKDFVAL